MRRWLATLAAACLLVAAFAAFSSALAPSAWAQEAPPAGAPPSAELAEKELEKRIYGNPQALLALVATKFLPAAIGLVVIVLWAVRRRDERRGLASPSRRSAPPPTPFRGPTTIALTLVAVVAGGLVSGVVWSVLAGPSAPGAPPPAMPLRVALLGTLASALPVGLVVAVFIRRAWRREGAGGAAAVFGDDGDAPDPTAGRRPWPTGPALRVGARAWFASSALVFVVSVATVLLLSAFGETPKVQHLVRVLSDRDAGTDRWLIAGFGILVAPVWEELVFRGMIYPAVRDLSSPRTGAIVSSVVFATVHGSLTAGPALFALAWLLCALYERTGRMFPGILLHAANNAASVLPLLLL